MDKFTLAYFDKRDSKEPNGTVDLSCVGPKFLSEGADPSGKAPPTAYALRLTLPGRNFQMAFNSEDEQSIWKTWFLELDSLLFGACVPGGGE